MSLSPLARLVCLSLALAFFSLPTSFADAVITRRQPPPLPSAPLDMAAELIARDTGIQAPHHRRGETQDQTKRANGGQEDDTLSKRNGYGYKESLRIPRESEEEKEDGLVKRYTFEGYEWGGSFHSKNDKETRSKRGTPSKRYGVTTYPLEGPSKKNRLDKTKEEALVKRIDQPGSGAKAEKRDVVEEKDDHLTKRFGFGEGPGGGGGIARTMELKEQTETERRDVVKEKEGHLAKRSGVLSPLKKRYTLNWRHAYFLAKTDNKDSLPIEEHQRR